MLVVAAALAGLVAWEAKPTDRLLIRPGAVDPHLARTTNRVEQLLADVPVLPRAVRVRSAPAHSLTQFTSDAGGGDHEIRRTEWFTAPGTRSAALAFFRTHPLDGLTGTGYGSSSVYFSGPNDDASRSVSLEVDVVAQGKGVAIRVDAYATWIPTRTTTSVIGTPTALTIIVVVTDTSTQRRVGVPVVRRASTAVARRLAREIDALPGGVAEYPAGCPAQQHVVTATLRFATGHGRLVLTTDDSACTGTATLRAPDGRTSLLDKGTTLADTLAALGLPSDYGQR